MIIELIPINFVTKKDRTLRNILKTALTDFLTNNKMQVLLNSTQQNLKKESSLPDYNFFPKNFDN